ncbi:MAG TPA: YdeI/OmpD-associated family protein [Anaeromyxobacteraceae bacterium]|nr:YdeI/OmpD-associated family protein [Anaeromyxobacteraceae bacterium]
MRKTFRTTIVRDGSMCFIPVPFDPRPVFGKVRAPVKVTLNGHSYRSTIASMGGGPCIPLRRSNREAAGLEGNETLSVTLELDAEKREVEPPPDLVSALKGTALAWDRWNELSYTHQREHVEAIEGAKKPETRARRIEGAVRAIASRPPRPAGPRKTARASPGPRLNAAWHESHPMPSHPTTEQRLAWHLAHEKNCGCRPMPARLRAMMR